MAQTMERDQRQLLLSKDITHPILETIILNSSFVVLSHLTREDALHILLGLTYAVLNLFGSYASHHAHMVKKHGTRYNACGSSI